MTNPNKISEAIIYLNNHVNARMDRAFNIRTTLGVHGTKALEDVFRATDKFLSSQCDKEMITKAKSFLLWINARPALKKSLMNTLGRKGSSLSKLELALK